MRIYDEVLVLFRTNYISALYCASPIGKGFGSRHLAITISLIFKDAGWHYPISRNIGVCNYRIFVKESNIMKISLNLHNNFCNDSALVLCNNGLFCLLFLSVLLLLKHFVPKITQYRGAPIFLFTLIHSWGGNLVAYPCDFSRWRCGS